MDLRNCPKCNRIFAYTGSELCSKCAKIHESDYKKVKDYLYDNPGATITEVSRETGVEEKQILRYLRESRIEIREENNLLLDCERCGKPIRTGRFCDLCIASMQKEFTSVIKPRKEVIKTKDLSKRDTQMYTAGMRKKPK